MPPAPPDPFNLDSIVDAQAPCHAAVLDELRRGRKRTHWMWFIFPQLAGLGSSATARHFALSGEAEARAYLNHPVLGARLVACAEAMLAAPGDSATAILGTPDDLKLCSCATLFARVAGPGSVFERLLARFYGGVPDARTLALLEGGEARRW